MRVRAPGTARNAGAIGFAATGLDNSGRYLPGVGNHRRATSPTDVMALPSPGSQSGPDTTRRGTSDRFRSPRFQEEAVMADRRGSKKVGRSIKEKRADRRAKQDASTQMERLTSSRKG